VFIDEIPGWFDVEARSRTRPSSAVLGLEGDVDGMVHLSDTRWKLPGEQVIDNSEGRHGQGHLLDVEVEKRGISWASSSLEGDPFAENPAT